MSYFHALFLGIIQGITEFLPISSSGHMIFFEEIFGLETSSLLPFDVSVHIGSLIAIIVYFWKNWEDFLKNTFQSAIAREKIYKTDIFRLFIGTLPVAIIGVFLQPILEHNFRSITPILICWTILGIILFSSKFIKQKNTPITNLKSFIIGIAQTIALLPGISRSGSTIITAQLLGISKEKAAEFSFFLGAVAIFGGGILTAGKIQDWSHWDIYLIGVIASFISSFFSIKFLMHIFKKHNLSPFSYYLWGIVILGIIIKTL